MRKYKVGVVGATGMVGQRFVTLLSGHPWFEITTLAASSHSAGKTYADAVSGRWAILPPIPEKTAGMIVYDASDIKKVTNDVDFLFCAIALNKSDTRALEEAYARTETPVISNNSACRNVSDVPMIIPEINPRHAELIPVQKRRLGTMRGFIAVKPNCSIQSYVPPLTPLLEFGIEKISVCTYQAISGAGKTFHSYPEIVDNIIPYIGGEEEKSEQEPLKIWGNLSEDGSSIIPGYSPAISAQCIRVPVSDGHMAAVSVSFHIKPKIEVILERWRTFRTLPQTLSLPSAPDPFLKYMEEKDRPQTKIDRDFGKGMGVTIGRLREDCLFDYKFVCLSHNTLRGAAGGGVLTAELLCKQNYIVTKE